MITAPPSLEEWIALLLVVRSMEIKTISDVETLLQGSPTVQDLHAAWSERRPVARADYKKAAYGASDSLGIPWLEDASLAQKFVHQALRAEEFLLVVDAAREILSVWANANEDDRSSLVHIRMDYAIALTRLGFTSDARLELEPCVDPGRPGGRVRLPVSAIPAAREALREQLERMGARVGLVSASAGPDLLFTEILRESGGIFHLVLPWSQDEFRRTSVLPFEPPDEPPLWEPQFDQALKAAATVREIGQVYEPGSDMGWQFMMEVTAGIALRTARSLRLDIQPLVLWDGLPGSGAGGTDSFMGFGNTSLALSLLSFQSH